MRYLKVIYLSIYLPRCFEIPRSGFQNVETYMKLLVFIAATLLSTFKDKIFPMALAIVVQSCRFLSVPVVPRRSESLHSHQRSGLLIIR
jgi:hypothetical protein